MKNDQTLDTGILPKCYNLKGNCKWRIKQVLKDKYKFVFLCDEGCSIEEDDCINR